MKMFSKSFARLSRAAIGAAGVAGWTMMKVSEKPLSPAMTVLKDLQSHAKVQKVIDTRAGRND